MYLDIAVYLWTYVSCRDIGPRCCHTDKTDCSFYVGGGQLLLGTPQPVLFFGPAHWPANNYDEAVLLHMPATTFALRASFLRRQTLSATDRFGTESKFNIGHKGLMPYITPTKSGHTMTNAQGMLVLLTVASLPITFTVLIACVRTSATCAEQSINLVSRSHAALLPPAAAAEVRYPSTV